MEQQCSKEQGVLRNTNIEVLRFVLMVAICFWHVMVHGFNFKSIGNPGYFLSVDRATITFFCSLFSPSVYCFLVISGWYGINFSLKKYLYFAFLAFSCYGLSIVFLLLWGEDNIEWPSIMSHIFPIASYKWWFMTYYVMVFLFAPFLECGLKALDVRVVKLILCISTFMVVGNFILMTPFAGYSFFDLLYIYFLARYLRMANFHCSRKVLCVIYIFSLLLLWGACYMASGLTGYNANLSFRLLNYSNPLIILMAFSIFFYVKDLKPFFCSKINFILSNTLVIYLLTEGVGGFLYKYEAMLISENLLCGIAVVLMTIFICLLVGKCLSFIFDGIFSSVVSDKK